MKIFLITTLTMFTFASVCFPQGMTDKGSMSLSGGLAYSSISCKNDNKGRSISLIPGFSYFVASNFEIGFNIRFNYSEEESKFVLFGENGKYQRFSRAFGIGPSFTYYVGSSVNKPFVFVSYTFNKVSSNENYAGLIMQNTDYTMHSLFFGTGYLVQLNGKLALMPYVQYEINRYEVNDDYSDLGALDNDTFSFGAQFKMFL